METQAETEKNIWRNEYYCRYLEGGDDVKLTLMVDATNRCQLRCGYCYYGEKSNELMDVKKVLAACTKVATLFSQRLKGVNINYMGGEPLLAWDRILDLNELAKVYFNETGIPFHWSMTSNLVALDEAKTEHMIREKAGIHCSIDGPQDIHDRNRPFENGLGSFSKVVKNIPLALRITPDDTARVTVCPEDAERLPEITHEILDYGFKKVGLFPVNANGWTIKAVADWQKGIFDAFKLVQKIFGKEKEVITFIRPTIRGGESKKSFSYCGAGKGLWGIGVDGFLYFCHQMTNCKELAIIDAASSSVEKIRAAIEGSSLPPRTPAVFKSCSNCQALDFCEGGCWAVNFFTNGSAIMPEKSNCALSVATAEAIGKMMYIDEPIEYRQDLNGYPSCTGCQGGCMAECLCSCQPKLQG